MNILITGCAGFIGYSLIEKLIKKNKYKITGVDNLNNINNDLKIKKKRLDLIKKKINFFNIYEALCPSVICKIYDTESDLLILRDNTHLSHEASLSISRKFKIFIKEELE